MRMTKWEYKRITIHGTHVGHFNNLGQEGWELCGIFSEDRPLTSPRWEHSAVFKRPIAEEAPSE